MKKPYLLEKASTSSIMNSYNTDKLIDLDMKFFMSVAMTSATALIMKASNEDFEESAVSTAIASTIYALNTLKAKQTKDIDIAKTNNKVIALEAKFLKVNELTELDKRKLIKFCLRCISYISRNLSLFGIENEQLVTGDV